MVSIMRGVCQTYCKWLRFGAFEFSDTTGMYLPTTQLLGGSLQKGQP